MQDDDKIYTMQVTQYKLPPAWAEWGGYLGAVALFAATIVNPGVTLWPAIITGGLLFWNYVLFRTLREYVRYVNASEISKLLVDIAKMESNKHKDGTISESDGLIKGEDDEEV